MTDNFKRYKEFIELCGGLPKTNEKGTLDKYYVIELMRRGKDNPNMPAANYHFRNYYIYSWHDLEKYEQEIKDICTLLKMRAYCSVNYKLMSQVALDTMAESARRIAAHDFKKFYNIFESASGKFVDRSNSMWVVDVDNVDEHFPLESLITCINSMESGYKQNVIYIMPTKSGLHLITHPFNLQKFNKSWNTSLAAIDIKKNHLTLLYENL
jgi:hypothetical protein